MADLDSDDQNGFCMFRLFLDSEYCGFLTAQKRHILDSMSAKYSTDIDIIGNKLPKSVVEISGDKMAVRNCINDFLTLYIGAVKQFPAKKYTKNGEYEIEVDFFIPNSLIGIIIGVKGSTLKRIRTESKAFFRVEDLILPESDEKIAILRGEPNCVLAATDIIINLILSVYEHDERGTKKPYFPTFEEFRNLLNFNNDYDEEGNIRSNRNTKNYFLNKTENEKFFNSNKISLPKNQPLFHKNKNFSRSKNFDRQTRKAKKRKLKAIPQNLIKYDESEKVSINLPINKRLFKEMARRSENNLDKIKMKSGAVITQEKEKNTNFYIFLSISGTKTKVREALIYIEQMTIN